MRDIETVSDIRLLTERFYEKLLLDQQIGHFFHSLDLALHLPRVNAFWSFILLDEPGYSGNMMQAHAKLQLTELDFERWVLLFHKTIDLHFQGVRASLAKERATLIAWTMKSKL